MDVKVKRIVFFDSKRDVDAYVRQISRNRAHDASRTIVIALRPNVRAHLAKKDIEARDTLRYFPNDSHRRCLSKSKQIVEWLRNEIRNGGASLGLTEPFFSSLILNIRAAIQYCLWVIEIVTNAIEHHGPDVIAFYSGRRRYVNFMRILPEERYMGRLIYSVARSRNIRCEDLSEKRFENLRWTVSMIKAYCILLGTCAVRYLRFMLWQMALSIKKSLRGRPIILFTTRRYRMDKLASLFEKKYVNSHVAALCDPIIFSMRIPDALLSLASGADIAIAKIRNELFGTLEKQTSASGGLFTYKGTRFSSFIAQKIRDNIKDFTVGMIVWSRTLDRLFARTRPSVVIANGDRHDDAIIAELCRRNNIRNILISHGSHVRPKNEYEAIEWGEHSTVFFRAPFSFLALQTPLAEAFVEALPRSCSTVKTGPLIWGVPVDGKTSSLLMKKLFGKTYQSGKQKIVLHCGTPKGSDNMRLHVYERPDEYIRALRDITESVRNIPETLLVIKFRPSFDIDVETLKRLVPFSDKMALSVGEPFIEILGMADLLASFSSTAIEEALQNRIPVLLYGGNGRYQHVPAYEVRQEEALRRSAVYFVRERGTLEYALRGILENDGCIKKDASLFDSYIYPMGDRIHITKLLDERIFT